MELVLVKNVCHWEMNEKNSLQTLSRAKAWFSFLQNYFHMRKFHFFRWQQLSLAENLSLTSFFEFLFSFHESVEEKNDPDIIPHDNSDDEKDFERLYTPTQLNFVNRHSPSSNSPTLRFNEKQVRISLTMTWSRMALTDRYCIFFQSL